VTTALLFLIVTAWDEMMATRASRNDIANMSDSFNGYVFIASRIDISTFF
jgi:hypothetical protein